MYWLRAVPLMMMMMILLVLLAYRAILAEPRTKASSTEDYAGGGARVDYMGGGGGGGGGGNNDVMNQYALPMGTQLFDFLIQYFFYIWKNAPLCDHLIYIIESWYVPLYRLEIKWKIKITCIGIGSPIFKPTIEPQHLSQISI